MWLQLTFIERSEGAELGDEFEIDIDNSEDKPQRGGASARGRGGKTSVSLSFYLSGHVLHIRSAVRPHLYLQDQPPSGVSSKFYHLKHLKHLRHLHLSFLLCPISFLIDSVIQTLMTRCQDQHETTNTLSAAHPDVISRTQKKVRWIYPDGTPKQEPHQVVEVEEGDHPVVGEVEGAVRLLLLNVLGNLGESRMLRGSRMVLHMYTVYNDVIEYDVAVQVLALRGRPSPFVCRHSSRKTLVVTYGSLVDRSDNKVRPSKRALTV